MLGPLQERVVKLLEDGRERTMEQILDELQLGLNTSTLRVCVNGLEKHGLVRVQRAPRKATRVTGVPVLRSA